MDYVRITSSASKKIAEECLRGQDTETGGLLIGTSVEPTIFRATVPGPAAELSPGSFKADIETEQRYLDAALRDSNGRLKLDGYWHLHPGNYSSPSSGDLAQAKLLLNDFPNAAEAPWILVMIANLGDSSSVELHAYIYEKGSADFSPVEILPIGDDSKEAKAALAVEPSIIVTRETDYWRDPAFRFYVTDIGNARLRKEVEHLTEAGYAVVVKRETETQRLFIDISKDELALRCCLPAEYPLNPPSVLLLPSEKPVEAHCVLCAWNSECSLATVVEQINTQTAKCKHDLVANATPAKQVDDKEQNGGRSNATDFAKRNFPTFITAGRLLGRTASIPVWGGVRRRRTYKRSRIRR